MCGIAGYAGFDDERLLRAMSARLAHRGPDDEGFHIAPGVGLSIRRLAIIDLKTGHQPIANETQDVWVVFNGEIYNYEELRERLILRGHTFATTSDTETIAHLYEDHGLDFVHHLHGMFALALWDSRRARVVLARDRVGEKPLYWARHRGGLLFGSEIKAILQGWGDRQADPQAVCDFLAAGYVGGPRTFFRGIAKLEPGTMLVYERRRLEVRRYWQPGGPGRFDLPFAEAAEQLADRLDETVRLCLKSDVEVGAFLSGGIDSSVIVALMRKHAANVKTFCVGYDGSATGFNELPYARRVAQHLGTEHHELILGPHSSLELLPRILWHYDEPHGEPTSVLVYLLCQFTRQHVKVAVSGTGGDELFFGYPRHKGIRLLERYRRLPRVLRRHLVERLVARWPESTRGSNFARRVKRFVSASDLPPAHAYLGWVSLLHPETREDLVSDALRGDAPDPCGEAFLRRYLMAEGPPLLDRAAMLDISGYLPEYQLAYMDRMSMAHGLEVRAPLCDFALLDLVTGLPAHYRLKGGRSKHILKEIAVRWLPRDIVERRKVGFDSPIGQWFKDELRPFVDGFLSPTHVERSGLLDPAAVQGLIAEHVTDRRDYSLQLWSVIALEAWHRMYIEDAITDGMAYQLRDLRGALPPTHADRLALTTPLSTGDSSGTESDPSATWPCRKRRR